MSALNGHVRRSTGGMRRMRDAMIKSRQIFHREIFPCKRQIAGVEKRSLDANVLSILELCVSGSVLSRLSDGHPVPCLRPCLTPRVAPRRAREVYG